METSLKHSSLTAIRSSSDRFWAWEVLSCCMSAASLAAIVVTLFIHDDRPLPQWPHYITINSLIAIFAAILKASIMMPVAEGNSWDVRQ